MQNIHHDLTLSWRIFQCSKIPMKSSIIFPMLNRSSKNPRLLDKSSKNPRDPHNKSWKNPRILDKSHEKNSPPRGKTKISSNILFVSFNTLHILRKSSEDMRFLESLKTCSNNHNRKHVLLKLHLKDRKKTMLFSWDPHQVLSKSPKKTLHSPKELYLLPKPPGYPDFIFGTNFLLNQGHHHHHHHNFSSRTTVVFC